MPAAALVKGILLSLGVLAALGFAAYENPEVQQWIDEQRRRLAELLRGIGEELDPQSRREAEAFAFHGRTPTQPQDNAEQTRGETTGASLPNNTVRRIPVQGSLSAADTEERQRLGREYLAARNQLLRVMRQRRGDHTNTGETSESQQPEASARAASPPPPASDVKVEQSEYYEAPPLPPKVKLEEVEPTPMSDIPTTSTMPDIPNTSTMPGSFDDSPPEMSYEEQIAHAIALSEQESNIQQATTRSAADAYDADVRKAVEASLRDFQNHMSSQSQPLDLMSTDLPGSTLGANVWSTEEDLYNVTPNLTRASLAALDKRPENASKNPFVEHETSSSFTSWSEADRSLTLPAEPVAADPVKPDEAQADNSDAEDAGIMTPDSWTEVGSIPDEAERVPAV